jgi:hypothetical protein
VCSIKPTLILAYICCTPLYTLNQSTTFPVPYLLSWYPFEFLNATDVVPAPIGPLHKCLPAGTFGATSAPAGPSVTMLGAPPMPLAPADDPLAPALYIPPALRAPGTPTAPRAAATSTALPRHVQPRTRPARLEAPHLTCCTSRLRFTRPRRLQHRPRAPQRQCRLLRRPAGPAQVPTSSSEARLHLPLHALDRLRYPRVLLLSLQ